jgi:hypothetical protein
MRMGSAAVALGCLLIPFLGCGGDGGAALPSPLQPRLDAAKAMSDAAARDKELAKLALEAATGGDIAVANESANSIANDTLREQTKAKVVLRLAKAGKTDGANALLRTIADAKTRDRLALKIRTRDFAD